MVHNTRRMPNEINNECQASITAVNEFLNGKHDSNFHNLVNCTTGLSGCSGNQSTVSMVDLVVLVDSSSSLYTGGSRNAVHYDAVIGHVQNALVQAENDSTFGCGADVRIAKVGVGREVGDFHYPGIVHTPLNFASHFDQSHQTYLEGYYAHETVLNYEADNHNHATTNAHPGHLGADAIVDLCTHNQHWREGACRVIYYIGDEYLDGHIIDGETQPDFEARQAHATQAAVTAANNAGVKIFTSYSPWINSRPSWVEDNYRHLAEATGGAAPNNGHLFGGEIVNGNEPTAEVYFHLFSDVVCDACSVDSPPTCTEAVIKPCISIKWGENQDELIQRENCKIMTISVCNCYTNVTFENFSIASIEASNPNGQSTSEIHPLGIYCFGDIPPCSCVTREFVLMTGPDATGDNTIQLNDICYGITVRDAHEQGGFQFSVSP